MKHRELTLEQMEKQMKAIVKKLESIKSIELFLAYKSIIKEAKYKFDVWETIKLGTGPKTADGFCRAIKKKGFNIKSTTGRRRCSAIPLLQWPPRRSPSTLLGLRSRSSASRMTPTTTRYVNALKNSDSSSAHLKSVLNYVYATKTSQTVSGFSSPWNLLLILTATRACSSWSVLILSCGSTATGAVLTASGMLPASGSSAVLSNWTLENLVSWSFGQKALNRIAREGFLYFSEISYH